MQNSQTHIARINKIRTGLVTAGLLSDAVTRIVKIFDALAADVARDLAARTRFSVGTLEKLMNRGTAANPNPEGRRQMCRAIYFLDDLHRIQCGQLLNPRSNDAFSALWKQNFSGLASDVKAAAQRLLAASAPATAPAPAPAPAPEIPFQPPPDPPIKRMVTMPPPGKYVMSSEMRGLLESMAKSKVGATQYRQDVTTFLQGNTGFERMVTMPESKKYLMTTEKRAMFDQLQAKRNAHLSFGIDEQSSMKAAHTAWGHAIAGIQHHFVQELTARVGSLSSLQVAAASAYREFEALFGDIAKEIEGNLSLAKSLFSMLESAPFPFSITGKIGSAVVSQLHVDAALPQTRDLVGRTYFNNQLPLLEDLKKRLQSIRDWKDDVTRLGVPASILTNKMSLDSAVDEVRRNSLTLLNNVFKASLEEKFGATPEQKIIVAKKFHDDALTNYKPLRDQMSSRALLTHVVITKITNFEAETKRAISDAVGTVGMVSNTKMQKFIELQLIAEYICKKFPKKPGEDFTGYIPKTIPDAIIERLEGSPFNLLQRKSGKDQTLQIFDNGCLPWASGHPNHVGALVYFSRWYLRNINPFDLAIGQKPEVFDAAINSYIRALGAAIKNNSQSRLLRHATTNWDAISSSH